MKCGEVILYHLTAGHAEYRLSVRHNLQRGDAGSDLRRNVERRRKGKVFGPFYFAELEPIEWKAE